MDGHAPSVLARRHGLSPTPCGPRASSPWATPHPLHHPHRTSTVHDYDDRAPDRPKQRPVPSRPRGSMADHPQSNRCNNSTAPPKAFGQEVSSPRERGWSGRPVRAARRAGCLPRASGGGPLLAVRTVEAVPSSPRERGWSQPGRTRRQRHEVFPARAGVVRTARATRSAARGLPRASGGGPSTTRATPARRSSSPRERGWSGVVDVVGRHFEAFPARAGVVPGRSPGARAWPGLPRASGGGPSTVACTPFSLRSSPRARGWSLSTALECGPSSVV